MIRKLRGGKIYEPRTENPATAKAVCCRSQILDSKFQILNSQSGMSLIAVMAVMTLFAIALLAIAPTVQQGVQREKELETIRRGEEIAEAIKQYVEFYRGTKLPDSMDELLEGLPNPKGTKKLQILRPSAAIDPLSADGKWRLVKPDSRAFINFGKRVQLYNNGGLPSTGNPNLDNYANRLTSIINSETDEDSKEAEEDTEVLTDKTPFIGVASQSRSTSVVAYYGIENHSKWVFTPLFRGSGFSSFSRGGKPKPNNFNSDKEKERQ